MLHHLGATIELDRSITERQHILVCTMAVHRVLVMVRETIANGAEFAVMAARRLAKETYGNAVEAIARNAAPEVREARLRETKAAASYVSEVSKAAVSFAYEASGSHGLRNPSRLQRCFRDIYVGAAHQVFDERNYVELAKEKLGLDPARF